VRYNLPSMPEVRFALAAMVLPTLAACLACSSNPPENPGAIAGAPSGAGSTGTVQAGTNAGGASGGAPVIPSGGNVATGGSGSAASAGAINGTGGGPPLEQPGAQRPFPQHGFGNFCSYTTQAKDEAARVAYQTWKDVTVTADGAGGFLRVKKPDSGAIVGSTASEGIGYGMILAVYFGDQALFDGLWRYEQIHLDDNGLMNWDIGPDGVTASAGMGGATDGDVDMAWALVMADRQWGGHGALAKSYLEYAKDLIDRIWKYEVDHVRGEMLMAGDKWGDVDVTNPSYFAPAYFRVFGKVTSQTDNWNKVIDANYAILAKSLNAASGNAKNGLAPAWCNSSGEPVEAFAGAPTYFQNDATRVPFRVGQDYCYFGEPRAKQYLALISSFYTGVGVANIVDGYNLDGTPHPDRAVGGLQAASFVGPAGVAGMSDATFRPLVDQAYAALATQGLTAGTIYYQKSWTALSLLMLTGNLVDLTAE
jgi:endo-1,4-beta-D-glucanase Y